MADLDYLRPAIADILVGLGVRETIANDGWTERSHALVGGGSLIRWVHDREAGPDRVLELETEMDGLRSELETEREVTAGAQDEVTDLKAKIKAQAAEIKALTSA